MSEIWKSCKPYIEEIAADCAMTPQQLIALKMLGKNGPMAMSELAVHLGCDASNVTSIVDKLETRRLVERRSSEQDRRVKSLVLTDAGSELFDRAMVRFQQPPPAINNLSEEDQEVLCGIFTRALFSVGAVVPEDLLRA
jgi:DNA-binding MarR family transcriptional regulator